MDLVDSASNELDPAVRRQRRLLIVAWVATLLPLLAFAYLTWEAVAAGRKVAEAQAQLNDLTAKTEAAKQEIAALRKEAEAARVKVVEQRESTKHYRDFAGIRVQFYRESDRATVETALRNLGFTVDSRLGSSPLIGESTNTLAYGTLVSEQDYRDIAIELVRAKFRLLRITPAMRRPDPKLIQIFASASSARNCGPLTEELIRTGKVCGPK